MAERDSFGGREAKYLAQIARFRLMDDTFLGVVFDSNTEATELVLRTILGKDDLKVLDVVGQRSFRNPRPDGRSVRLDILATDSSGKLYNIEIQRADHGAVAQRARYNSSMLDMQMLDKGQDFSELRESYVIFITENDVLGKGLPLYHIDRIVHETGERFKDGAHIIYVNGSYEDNEHPIGKLMHDFRSRNADEMQFPLLAENVRYFKESERGQGDMCRVMEELMEDLISESKAEGELIAYSKLIKDGTISIEKAATMLNMSVEALRLELSNLQT